MTDHQNVIDEFINKSEISRGTPMTFQNYVFVPRRYAKSFVPAVMNKYNSGYSAFQCLEIF